MRIDSINLPQAAQKHSKVHGSGKVFPETAVEKNKAAAAGKEAAVAASPDAAPAPRSSPRRRAWPARFTTR